MIKVKKTTRFLVTALALAGIFSMMLFTACDTTNGSQEQPVQHNIFVNQPAGGGTFTVQVGSAAAVNANTTAAANTVITLTATPASATWDFIEFILTGADVILHEGQGTTRTFNMPAGNVTVTARFDDNTFAINITDPDNGALTTNVPRAAQGDTVTVTAAPNADFGLSRRNGVAVTGVSGTVAVTHVTGNNWTFVMPGENVTIAAGFVPLAVIIDDANPSSMGGLGSHQGGTAGFGSSNILVNSATEPPFPGATISGTTHRSRRFTYVDYAGTAHADDVWFAFDINFDVYEHDKITFWVRSSHPNERWRFGLQTPDNTVHLSDPFEVTSVVGFAATAAAAPSPIPLYWTDRDDPVWHHDLHPWQRIEINLSEFNLPAGETEIIRYSLHRVRPTTPHPVGRIWIDDIGMARGAAFNEPPPPPLTITGFPSENGTFTANPATTAEIGEVVTLTATPAALYRLVRFEVTRHGGRVVPLQTDYTDANIRTFLMPAANVIVTATFESAIAPPNFDVNIASGITGGTITPSTDRTAEGTQVTLTVTPAAGFGHSRRTGVTVTGDDSGDTIAVTGSGNTWTFLMPDEDVTVSAGFVPLRVVADNFNDNTSNGYIHNGGSAVGFNSATIFATHNDGPLHPTPTGPVPGSTTGTMRFLRFSFGGVPAQNIWFGRFASTDPSGTNPQGGATPAGTTTGRPVEFLNMDVYEYDKVTFLVRASHAGERLRFALGPRDVNQRHISNVYIEIPASGVVGATGTHANDSITLAANDPAWNNWYQATILLSSLNLPADFPREGRNIGFWFHREGNIEEGVTAADARRFWIDGLFFERIVD